MKNFVKASIFVSITVALVIIGGIIFFSRARSGPHNRFRPSNLTKTPYVIVTRLETGISREEAAKIIPIYPSVVSGEIKENGILIKWRGTGEDVDYYEILRKTSETNLWIKIVEVKSFEENSSWYEWLDSKTASDTFYVYGVRAVNIYGVQSIIAESPIVNPSK